MAVFKAKAHAKRLTEMLRISLGSTLTVLETEDSNKWPILEITKGLEKAFVKIEDTGVGDRKDAVTGAAQRFYSPHKLSLIKDSRMTGSLTVTITDWEAGESITPTSNGDTGSSVPFNTSLNQSVSDLATEIATLDGVLSATPSTNTIVVTYSALDPVTLTFAQADDGITITSVKTTTIVITISDWETGESIIATVNGIAQASVPFNTDNNTSVSDLATNIAGAAGVASATPSTNTITVVSDPDTALTISLGVTGGDGITHSQVETQEIVTTISDWEAGESIVATINGVAQASVPFTTNNNTSVAALATVISGATGVASATPSTNTITITSDPDTPLTASYAVSSDGITITQAATITPDLNLRAHLTVHAAMLGMVTNVYSKSNPTTYDLTGAVLEARIKADPYNQTVAGSFQ
jgi:hypothetical protein